MDANHGKKDLLAWVDVETTGLDPSNSHLLEVAFILTDATGEELSSAATYHSVVAYSEAEAAALRAEADDYVRDMHDKSGLWDRLPTEGLPLAQIDREVAELIRSISEQPRTFRAAGNSVRLDLNFLEAYLPTTAALLHYRFVDVTTLEWFCTQLGVVDGAYPKKLAHEALPDIRESIGQYRWLRAAVEARDS